MGEDTNLVVLKPKKVYIVTSGSMATDDYEILKVFIDKDKADDYSEWCPESKVEEYVVGDLIDNNEVKSFIVRMGLKWNKDCTLEDTSTDETEYGIQKYIGNPFNFQRYSERNDKHVIVIARTILAKDYDDKKMKEEMKNLIYKYRKRVMREINLGKTPEYINLALAKPEVS